MNTKLLAIVFLLAIEGQTLVSQQTLDASKPNDDIDTIHNFALIEKALDRHPGQVQTNLVAFGSWQKYYTKEQQARRNSIRLISLQRFLADDRDPKKLFLQFKKNWDESKWGQRFRGKSYMREPQNNDWIARMKLLRGLAAIGKASIVEIENQLLSEHLPTRIVAAQSISYLAKHADVDLLMSLYEKEPDPAVRLYLVDAIGMSGKGDRFDWDSLLENERNRDVRMHMNYAKERGNSPVDDQVVRDLANWNPDAIAPVVKGQPAPDFVLKSFDGNEFKLSQFKGVKPVVLVFVYGDT